MKKMGGVLLCDVCRIIINEHTGYPVRKSKSGRTLHFCSLKCKYKDTPQKKKEVV